MVMYDSTDFTYLPITTGHRLSANTLASNVTQTVGQLLADSRPTVAQLSADSWPTVGRQLGNSGPTVGRQLTDSRPTGFLGSSSSQFTFPSCWYCCYFLKMENHINLVVDLYSTLYMYKINILYMTVKLQILVNVLH